MIISKRKFIKMLILTVILLPVIPATAFQFIPPKKIVSKEKLPIKSLNMIRTEQGLTYFISPDGRYVLQGTLFDVWNGKMIKSIGELNRFSGTVNLEYLGVNEEKMFTLSLGNGPSEVFIFSDPDCGLCHKLLEKIRESRLIKSRYLVRIVITPLAGKSSMDKAVELSELNKHDPMGAVNAFIEDSYTGAGTLNKRNAGIEYNLRVAKALSIDSFPFLINSRGRTFIGLPDDLYLFLSEG